MYALFSGRYGRRTISRLIHGESSGTTAETSVMEVEEQPQVIDKRTKYVTIDCGFGYDKKVILEKWGDTP